MALPEVKVKISADTQEAEAGFNRVEAGLNDVGNAASRASTRVNAIDAPMRKAARSTGNLRFAVQNASFQLADMATMMEMGMDKSRIFAQQIPQMLGPLGSLGAILGVIVAVGIPLATTMQGMADSGRDVGNVFGTLQPIMEDIGRTFAMVGPLMASALELVINNIDRIIITAGVVAGLFAGKWVVAFVAARVATFSLAGALVALRVAIIRTGIGALIIGIGEAIYQFTRLARAAGGFGEAMSLLGDVAAEVWQRIGNGADYVVQSVVAMSEGMKSIFMYALHDMAASFFSFINGVAQSINDVFGTSLSTAVGSDILTSLNKAGSDAAVAAQGASGKANAALEAMSAPLQSIQKIRDLLAGMKDEKITLPDILGLGDGEDSKGGKGGKGETLKEKLTRSQQQIKEFLDNIKALTQGSLADQLGSWGDYFSNLVTLTGTNNERLLSLSKAFSAGQALINAWLAYTEVLKDPTLPWWARIAAAGNVLAAGLGAVNAIKGVTAGGSSSGGAGASGGGAGVGSSGPAAQSGVANLTFIGTQSAGDMRNVVEQINELTKQGYRINARAIAS